MNEGKIKRQRMRYKTKEGKKKIKLREETNLERKRK